MIEMLISFFGTALAYCSLAVALVWSAERLGWLREGAFAELAWRGALWLGIAVAVTSALRLPMADLWWSLRTPTPAGAPVPNSAEVTATEHRAASSAFQALRALRPKAADQIEPAAVATPSAKSAHLDTNAAQALTLLVGACLLFAVITLLRSVWSGWRMLHRARSTARPALPHWRRYRDQLSHSAGEVNIVSVAALDSPVAAHSGLILLPDWCDALSADAQRAVLAHELVHIERRDPRWRVLDAIAVALLAGFPLARHAQSRLHDLSEFACDSEAARRSGAPRALAECLAHCLEHSLSKTPALAVAMATPARGIVARVQRLLEDKPVSWNTWSATSKRIAVAAIAALALILPGIAITVAGETDGDDTSISIHSGTSVFGYDTLNASYSGGDRKLKLRIEGKVEFNDAETEIASISEDGELSIVEQRDGVKRELRVTAAASGLARLYRVDGDEVPYDAAAAQWFSAILPDIFRTTGLDAEKRLKRILARGGVDAALAEIALIKSDYVRSSYIGDLFSNAELDATQLDRVVVLIDAITSEYELRRALTPALAAGRLSDASQARVLGLAARMESDYERAELLIDASKQIVLDGQRLPAWQKATEGIESDYEKRRVLEALLAQKQRSPAHAQLAIAMAGSIASDYEKRMLLEAAAGMDAIDRSAYVRVASGIGSDYERREALMRLLAKGAISKEIALDIIAAAADIGSDYEAKELLLAIAKVMPSDAQVIEAYRAVTRTLSTYERGEAEAGLDRFFAGA
jgi:beta-lactamase regulating signal transducer with metallopeptidase domain